MKVDSAEDAALVEWLLRDSPQFKRLYNRHNELDRLVDKEHGARFVVNQDKLDKMKKEKLRLKDELERMLDQKRML